MSNAALVLRARGGDELAFRRLLEQHCDLISFAASKYFAPGLDRDDFEAEALHGFHKAVRDYKPERGVHFSTFAKGCVERQVITALKTARRNKHEVLNLASSINAPIDSSASDEGLTLADVLPDAGADVLQALDTQEKLSEVLAAVTGLSPLEHTALIGVAQGESYDEVARRSDVTAKVIDNALQRARGKVAVLLLHPAAGSSAGPPSCFSTPPPAALPARRPASPPRRRQLCRPAVPPPNRKGGNPVPSIVESIDGEISTVQEEISILEQQLDGKRIHLEDLNDLRSRAESLGTAAPPRAAAQGLTREGRDRSQTDRGGREACRAAPRRHLRRRDPA